MGCTRSTLAPPTDFEESGWQFSFLRYCNTCTQQILWVLWTHAHTYTEPTLTIVKPFGLPLQGHAGRVGLYASSAATGAVGAFQWNHDVTQLGAAEGAAVDELVLMDDPSSNTFRQSQDVKVKMSSWHASLSVTFKWQYIVMTIQESQ